jgi:hypothetical protein
MSLYRIAPLEVLIMMIVRELLTVFVPLVMLSSGQQTQPTALPPGVVWMADHETGNLSQWRGPTGGGPHDSGLCIRPPDGVSTVQPHTGRYALRATINTTYGTAACRTFREEEVRTGQTYYYGAWFYFPSRLKVGSFLNLMQFKANQSGKIGMFWKLDTRNRPNGNMYMILIWKGPIDGPRPGDGIRTRIYQQTLADLPVAQWVHLEVFLRQSEQYDGRITVWQNGVQVFDQDQVRTRFPSSFQSWSVNHYGQALKPAKSSAFIDDVTVSTVPTWTNVWQP